MPIEVVRETTDRAAVASVRVTGAPELAFAGARYPLEAKASAWDGRVLVVTKGDNALVFEVG